uniref:t-SNARE coiled-coil homology domain-containing protein n=1 Tax=Elaeophora elaphi TaxID=1147741 RepID=A0A0R3RW72_9BILA
MFRKVLSRYAPGISIAQQVSRRLFAAQANLQQPTDSGSHPSSYTPSEKITPTVGRRNINRVCLSGTVTSKPFYGTTRNGGKFGVVRITSHSFGGQYDFRVRLGTRTSLAYCRENVDEGSHLFVFGRLATFPRATADGTQGSSGTIMASRISVENQSATAAVNENEQFEDGLFGAVILSHLCEWCGEVLSGIVNRSLFFETIDEHFSLRLDCIIRHLEPVKSYTTMSSNNGGGSIEDDVNFYERELERYMQESLDSTERSRKNLEQSEQIGIATAQDLLTQREKLEHTEKNLDDIDRTTKMTQRNLNSLKSVFGGFFKNKFSRAPKEETSMVSSKSESFLGNAVDKLSNTTNKAGSSCAGSAVSAPGPTLSESSRAAIKGTRWEAMDNEIDSNLDSMSSQLARLRMLGTAIGEEVDSQNEMLDRIQVKAERTNTRVKDQDKQMKKLLGTADKDETQPSLPSVSKKRIVYSAVKSAF